MTTGLAPRLPLRSSRFELITDYRSLVQQNLKNLILTNPGERCMDTRFGVGLRRYLFEINDDVTYQEIAVKIRAQVAEYMPFVEIQAVEFKSPQDNPDLFPNFIRTTITFKIVPLQTTGIVQLDTNID